ncbi:hypothetical protein PHYBLDRAFT_147001 [Phycomyces blakesleeanus NRRL 1555(-)]|uniref:Endonuclease/exonuclease/phosphatase domain-containing protein n=1 Tax=Phycomyces blakesleeanus (strain ATCC 8743b / DSM 1359 / FGSC 10004 / NBRC 33097 / NRRL 1555) TaxID=763407 RepID=A0A162TYI5_PHYB8|nr:hypothetical protein PHYBLDRAFT_147001 [Phycomyces blakesleeanus NRRL 1555(-)]OAD72022.1 hypothetical protein PHYBLDRAFT_147001 [Phycomyces blakesleeanus NRRL 1555(-)]|eukprot:XP_018290062.1 hypothetical protein PHYBLDRAFT_147001 [Phycomyces blakesleeanus NRRL 1555(-)]
MVLPTPPDPLGNPPSTLGSPSPHSTTTSRPTTSQRTYLGAATFAHTALLLHQPPLLLQTIVKVTLLSRSAPTSLKVQFHDAASCAIARNVYRVTLSRDLGVCYPDLVAGLQRCLAPFGTVRKIVVRESYTFFDGTGSVLLERPETRSLFIRHLRSKGIDVLVLQETYIHSISLQDTFTILCGRCITATVSYSQSMFTSFRACVIYAPATHRERHSSLTSLRNHLLLPVSPTNMVLLSDLNHSLTTSTPHTTPPRP